MILVYKGSCLKETDLTGPATIIYVKSKHPYDKFLYPEWIDLLDSNKEFQKINAKINIPTNFSPLTAENIKFFDRLYIAGIETIIYIIGKKFGKIIKKLGVSKGHFLILNLMRC